MIVFVIAASEKEFNKFLTVNNLTTKKFKNVVNRFTFEEMKPEDEWIRVGKWHRRTDIDKLSDFINSCENKQSSLGMLDYLP